MPQPNVSVVIPTYNRATLVVRALRSVLSQVAEGDEIIIVDDGSTDNTEDVLRPYRDRIRYIKTGNAGAGAARNRGVRESRHPLVAFLDSDDEWLPNKLQLQRALMQERKEIVYCFSDFSVIHSNNQLDRRYLRNWNDDDRPWNSIVGPGVPYSSIATLPAGCNDFQVHVGNLYIDMVRADYIAAFTAMVRRLEAGSALHFAEDLPTYEDWECFGRVARVGPGAYLDCETAIQHGHQGPRLTQADTFVCANTRLVMLSRIWGQDTDFMAQHGDTYRQTVEEQKTRRIYGLLKRRATREARKEIGLMEHCPWRYRLAARLPVPLLSLLLAASDLFDF